MEEDRRRKLESKTEESEKLVENVLDEKKSQMRKKGR